MSRVAAVRALLTVRVKPRAGREGVGLEQDGRIVVRVTVPPADGKANARTIALLATALGVPKTSVGLLRGTASRTKVVTVDGVTAADAMKILREQAGRA